jgi:predicted DCC family thiol-disulfide oxidoreductase YuxK
MPVPVQFPLRIFYDGACPLCSREIEHYRRQDRAARLVPVDISVPGFDPGPFGIPLSAFTFELHAIDQAGQIYRGVEAFRAIWQAFPDSTGYRALATVVALPVINPLARLGYRLFARVRPRLPGRKPGCDEGTCRVGSHPPAP